MLYNTANTDICLRANTKVLSGTTTTVNENLLRLMLTALPFTEKLSVLSQVYKDKEYLLKYVSKLKCHGLLNQMN